MKVIDIVAIEDCFDGSYIKDIQLDAEITHAFIMFLGGLGMLKYYSDFSRPFFSLDIMKKMLLKGVEGNTSFRVVVYSGATVSCLEELTGRIQEFGKGDIRE